MINLDNWTDIKNKIDSHKIYLDNIQYEELDSGQDCARYIITTTDGIYFYQYILKHSDTNNKTDFDDNYKSNANKVIQQPIRIIRNLKKYKSNFTEQNLSCNDIDYTLFYTINFNKPVLFEELLITCQNDHIIKIEIDSEIILDDSIKDLWNILTDKQLMNSIKITKNLSEYCIKFDFNKYEATEIKIYQKRRDNKTAKIKTIGYVISYEEIG
jgi:hypothetical protein